jgi:hypothetical protein
MSMFGYMQTVPGRGTDKIIDGFFGGCVCVGFTAMVSFVAAIAARRVFRDTGLPRELVKQDKSLE